MSIADYPARVKSKYLRLCADRLFRRPFPIGTGGPFISFTFDDFPATALSAGGAILQKYGLLGTYYVSLDLAGKIDASGPMFSVSDLTALRQQGHELGCHTFLHSDSAETPPSAFLHSVISNERALRNLFPEAAFQTFSFPKSAPRANTKRKVGARFGCCRGGGQTFNTGIADLNYLRAYFLEQARGDFTAIQSVVDRNREARGWLIFATHDVCENPSPYGCTPAFFEAAVQAALSSGAEILPVTPALQRLRK